MARFVKLQVWQQSRDLLRTVSVATATMRNEGDLKSQMRRSAISIASTIAEGAERSSDRDFLRFLRIADGSAAELQAQAMIAADCGCIEPDQAEQIIGQTQVIGRMLNRLMARLIGDR